MARDPRARTAQQGARALDNSQIPPGSFDATGEPPAPDPAPPDPQTEAPAGVRAQLGATRDAFRRLFDAHVDLAKAELSQIGGAVAQMAALVGCAIVLLVLVGLMLVLGTSLFLGEWLFGSIGWGVLHASLFFTALAIMAVMVGLAFSPIRLFLWFLLAFLLGFLIALIFGFDVLNQVYATIGNAILPGVDAANRPLVTGVLLVGLIGLVLALIAFLGVAGTRAFRERPGSAILQLVLALLVGFLYGAFIGALTSITFAWRPAFGLGLAIAYALWIVFLIVDLARTGIDEEALKERFYPGRTIETTKETLEWLQKRMPRENGS